MGDAGRTIVLGAGAAGLGAARALQGGGRGSRCSRRRRSSAGWRRRIVWTALSSTGPGMSSTFETGTSAPSSSELSASTQVTRRAAVMIGDARVPYPLQYNLWALGSSAVA